jgi:Cu(I)/Ag(I) efflux system membrane fusion protein
MSLKKWSGSLVIGISLALGVAGGYWFAHLRMSEVPSTVPEQSLNSPNERKALYWYDPMYPTCSWFPNTPAVQGIGQL